MNRRSLLKGSVGTALVALLPMGRLAKAREIAPYSVLPGFVLDADVRGNRTFLFGEGLYRFTEPIVIPPGIEWNFEGSQLLFTGEGTLEFQEGSFLRMESCALKCEDLTAPYAIHVHSANMKVLYRSGDGGGISTLYYPKEGSTNVLKSNVFK